MTKKTMTAKNAAAAKRVMKAPKPTAPSAANLKAAEKNVAHHVVNGVPCALIDNTDARRRRSTKAAATPAAQTAPDGGKPEAIRAAAKKAASLADAPADAVVKVSRSRKKAVENFKKAVSTAAPDPAKTEAKIVHGLLALNEKLVLANFLAEEFLRTMPINVRWERSQVAFFLEHWFQLIDREIAVPKLSKEQFDKWVSDDLRKQIGDGEYVRLLFSNGARGIALGTFLYPAVLYQEVDPYLSELETFNPAMFAEMKKLAKHQSRITFTFRGPSFLMSMVKDSPGAPLGLDQLYEVFGNPLLKLTPDAFLYNLSVKMNQARQLMVDGIKETPQEEPAQKQAA